MTIEKNRLKRDPFLVYQDDLTLLEDDLKFKKKLKITFQKSKEQ